MPSGPFQSIGGTQAVLREKRLVIQDSEGRDMIVLGKDDDGLICLTFYDSDGDVRGRIGQLVAGGGSGDAWGIEVVSQPGTGDWVNGSPFFRATEDGAEFPYGQIGMVPANATTVTSATFTELFGGAINIIMHKYVMTYVRVVTDGSTTGEIRVTNVSAGTASPAVTVPINTNAYVQIPPWFHNSPLWTGPITFGLEARRASGAGTFQVYELVHGLGFVPR
jgi:hypothetical protein